MTFSDRDLKIDDWINQFEFNEYKHIIQYLRVEKLPEEAINALEKQALDIVHANWDNKETLISHLKESEMDATIIQIYWKINWIYNIKVDWIYWPWTNNVVDRIFENNKHLWESTETSEWDLETIQDSPMEVLKELIDGESSQIDTNRPPAVEPETFERYLSWDQTIEQKINEPMDNELERSPAVDPEEYERILSQVRSEKPEESIGDETTETWWFIIYTIKPWDNIWKIVKNEYNINNTRKIQEKVNEIINLNYERGYLDNKSWSIEKWDNLLLPWLWEQAINRWVWESWSEISIVNTPETIIPENNSNKVLLEREWITTEENTEFDGQNNDENVDNIKESISDRLDLSWVKVPNYKVVKWDSLWNIVSNQYDINDNSEIQKVVDVIIQINYFAWYLNNRVWNIEVNQVIFLPPLKPDSYVDESNKDITVDLPEENQPAEVDREINDLWPVISENNNNSVWKDENTEDNEGIIEDSKPTVWHEEWETTPEEDEKSEEEIMEERWLIRLEEWIYYNDPNKL